jgi:nuclear mRNA export protein PCID2/THP1
MAIIEEFLSSILRFLRTKDAANLQLWLRVEPPLPDQYYQLGQELRQSYSDSKALEKYIEKLLPENSNGKADEGDTWPGFLAFMKEYLEFWRDVNFDDLLETHNQLSGVVKYARPLNKFT